MSVVDDYFEIIIPGVPGREDKKYMMRHAKWTTDFAMQQESRDAKGEVNDMVLWMKRLSFAVQDMTEDKIRKMERWEMNGLIMRWMEHNEVNEGRFLATSPKGLSEALPTISS